MTNVSRPLIGLLVATVVFFALWIVALRPSSSSTGPNGTPGLGQYQSAINQAKASAASQNRAAAAANGSAAAAASSPSATPGAAASAKGSAATPAASSTATPAVKSAPKTVHPTRVHAASAAAATHHTRVHATPAATATTAHHGSSVRAVTTAERRDVVARALAEHKVLALLVYNPAAADDRAVKRELATISTSHGRVVKLAIPVSEVTSYPVITSQVEITSSPTLVIIDPSAQAFTLVGYASQFEIARRIGDALRMH